eukprot:s3299_g2.t1
MVQMRPSERLVLGIMLKAHAGDVMKIVRRLKSGGSTDYAQAGRSLVPVISWLTSRWRVLPERQAASIELPEVTNSRCVSCRTRDSQTVSSAGGSQL